MNKNQSLIEKEIIGDISGDCPVCFAKATYPKNIPVVLSGLLRGRCVKCDAIVVGRNGNLIWTGKFKR